MQGQKVEFEAFLDGLVERLKEDKQEKLCAYVKIVKATTLENFMYQFYKEIAPLFNRKEWLAMKLISYLSGVSKTEISEQDYTSLVAYIRLFCDESLNLLKEGVGV